MIFISHASADRVLAQSLARHIEACGPDVETFVASRAGDIRADTEWLPSIQKALRDADVYVVLLTVNSVMRPWVNFEAGAAWFNNKTCILVGAGGLVPGDIPLPLSAKQVYSLDRANDVQAVFRALGLQTTAIHELVADAVAFASAMRLAGDAELAWEGLEFQGTFYAWAGPLHDLEDRDGVQCPPQVIQLLKNLGMGVRLCSPKRLSDHFGRGRCQVFATNKKSWRRPVVRDRKFLLVTRPDDVKD